MSRIIKKEVEIEHPLEDILEIEPGTTMTTRAEILPAPTSIVLADYDEKDTEIEEKLDEIYQSAMGQAESIGDQIEVVEGKYKARVGEVSASMLTVALGAVREKRELKQHKDKFTLSSRTGDNPRTVNNNLILTHKEMLDLVKGKKPVNDED